MEFILVPVIFAAALLLLSLGRLLGHKSIEGSCSAGSKIEGIDSCAACSTKTDDILEDEAGLKNVAELGNPNRKHIFIDKLDFKPDKLN